MELKPGHKHTEVGLIPQDWDVKRLRDISGLDVGYAFKSAWFSKYDGVPLLRGENVGYGRPDWSDKRTLPSWRAQSFAEYELQPGEIVIGMDRTFTKSGVRISILGATDCPSLLVQRVGRFVPRACAVGFLWTLLSSTQLQELLRAQQKGMDIPHLSRSEILDLPVPVPPARGEQEAIASVVGDADALIESLEQFLAKKRHIKQGAMQELLTGKRRLSSFSTPWQEVTIGDLLTFKNGLNKAKRFFGQGTPIVNYMDVFDNPAIRSGSLQGRVSLTSQELNNFDVRKGDVLFTRTSETVAEVGMASVLLDEPHQTVFSGFVLRGRPRNARLSDQFKAYCFRSEAVRKQIVSSASYTTRALTNGRLLSAVRLTLPDPEEQTAIAAVLSDMDAEIEALEAKLAKARQIKQGMMQELLTGRIRLV